MKKLFFFCFVVLVSVFQNKTKAQCTVTGWASQNGGVTGGGTATPTVVTTYAELKTAVTSSSVKVIHISGQITFPSAGRITINSQSGKSILGLAGARLISTDMTTSGSGIFYLKNSSNIIIKNITFEGPGAYDVDGGDNLTIDNSTNVWVDHCTFEDSVDGNLDIKSASNYITITWTKFQYLKPPTAGGSGGSDDHRFSNLFGSSDSDTGDTDKLKITMQYCWWGQGVRERMPRIRYGQVHLVNNYFSSSVSNKCIYAGYKANVLIESNYFEGVKNPISLETGNFTAAQSVNNIFSGTSGTSAGSGTAFTPPYSYTAISAADVKQTVMNGAGAVLASPTDCLLAVADTDFKSKQEFTFFPNPATEKVSLKIFSDENNTPITISVIDVSGKCEGVIYKGFLQKGDNVINDISVKKIGKGVKVFQVKTNSNTSARKIIVK
ncbi:MAG: T9SS type A sorting domain-containing protein [Bergeyella sp.]